MPRLLPLLKEGFTINEMLKTFNTKLTPKLEVGITSIKSALRRIWKNESEYYENFCENNTTDPDNVSNSRYPSDPFREFLWYLHRLYSSYPKVNSDITEILTGKTNNPEEVDRELLKYMLYEGYNIEKIMQAIDRPRKWTSGWFKSILGMDYNTAKYEYYWRPKILEILKDNKSIPTGGEVAQRLRIEQNNLGRILKKAFPNKISEVLSTKELFEKLKKNFIKDYKGK